MYSNFTLVIKDMLLIWKSIYRNTVTLTFIDFIMISRCLKLSTEANEKQDLSKQLLNSDTQMSADVLWFDFANSLDKLFGQ